MTSESYSTCGGNRMGRQPLVGRHTGGQGVAVRTGKGVRLGGDDGEGESRGRRCRVPVDQG